MCKQSIATLPLQQWPLKLSTSRHMKYEDNSIRSFLLQSDWNKLMVQFVRRNAESHANLFVVNATTPAQLFHALRRQMNRPYQKPLVLLTPKFLLHHRPATSALKDFLSGTFFNRVIDDCKVSGNLPSIPPDIPYEVSGCSRPVKCCVFTSRYLAYISSAYVLSHSKIQFPTPIVYGTIEAYELRCVRNPKCLGKHLHLTRHPASSFDFILSTVLSSHCSHRGAGFRQHQTLV